MSSFSALAAGSVPLSVCVQGGETSLLGDTQALTLGGAQPPAFRSLPPIGTDLHLHFLHFFELFEQTLEVSETVFHADLLKVLLGQLGQNLQHLLLICHLLLLLLGSRRCQGGWGY